MLQIQICQDWCRSVWLFQHYCAACGRSSRSLCVLACCCSIYAKARPVCGASGFAFACAHATLGERAETCASPRGLHPQNGQGASWQFLGHFAGWRQRLPPGLLHTCQRAERTRFLVSIEAAATSSMSHEQNRFHPGQHTGTGKGNSRVQTLFTIPPNERAVETNARGLGLLMKL